MLECFLPDTFSLVRDARASSRIQPMRKYSTRRIVLHAVTVIAFCHQGCSLAADAQTGKCGGTNANIAWVYNNGAMSSSWPFDYSYGGLVVEYKDTSGVPVSGPHNIKVTGPVYAGWQPASRNYKFDVTGCKYLTFALKPTVVNQQWASYFMYEGDRPTKVTIIVTAGGYGPAAPAKNQWSVYKIPLSAFFPNGVVPALIYKFSIQDITGNSGNNNTWYIDNVGFTGS